MRFDDRASGYATHARPQAAVARRLGELIPAVDSSVEALELGAGTGLLTAELLRLGYKVRATDNAPAMLAVGRRAAPGADWVAMDAWTPPPACCDRIFSASLLQWCPDPTATFRRYREALRPGGLMTHAVFVRPTLRELYSLPGVPSPLVWRKEHEWLDAARVAGFRTLSAQNHTFRTRHADAAALLREIHGTGAVSGKSMLSAGALRRVLREYDRRFASPEGGVEATWSALLFTAARD